MTQSAINGVPAIGAGTFRLQGETAYQSVAMALEVGYRHIDTAQIYGNEAEVGQAMADSGIARDEIFLTTKVWMDKFAPERFLDSVRESLAKLQTEYVDLLLIHWPLKHNEVAMEIYLAELKKAHELGLARQIGISNFTVAQTKEAMAILGNGLIATNQIEVHPFLQNRTVVEFCQQHNILVTGYMPLAYGDVFKDETLNQIAAKHGTTGGNVALAWARQLGLVTIPSSTKRDNLAANLLSLDLQLDADDMAAIAQLERGYRIADPDFGPEWDQ